MNTTLTIKIDKETKEESQRIADKLGFTLSSVIKAQLRNFIRTRRVDVTLGEEQLTEDFQEGLKEAEEDIKTGKVKSFKDSGEMLKFLDQEIEDEKSHTITH
jgi:addiction module RelB/DinJ family antitoxin